jgi:hypothetical protein
MTALVAEARRGALDALSVFHIRQPARPGMPVETLRRGAHRSMPVAEAAVADLAAAGAIRVEDGVARLAGFEARLLRGRTGPGGSEARALPRLRFGSSSGSSSGWMSRERRMAAGRGRSRR